MINEAGEESIYPINYFSNVDNECSAISTVIDRSEYFLFSWRKMIMSDFYQYLFIYLLSVFCFSLKIHLTFRERLILNSLKFNSRK